MSFVARKSSSSTYNTRHLGYVVEASATNGASTTDDVGLSRSARAQLKRGEREATTNVQTMLVAFRNAQEHAFTYHNRIVMLQNEEELSTLTQCIDDMFSAVAMDMRVMCVYSYFEALVQIALSCIETSLCTSAGRALNSCKFFKWFRARMDRTLLLVARMVQSDSGAHGRTAGTQCQDLEYTVRYYKRLCEWMDKLGVKTAPLRMQLLASSATLQTVRDQQTAALIATPPRLEMGPLPEDLVQGRPLPLPPSKRTKLEASAVDALMHMTF